MDDPVEITGIVETGNPVFPWKLESWCMTRAEAEAKYLRVKPICAERFIPVEPVAHHATFAPLPPHPVNQVDEE